MNTYYNENIKLRYILNKLHRAWVRGVRKSSHRDPSIGIKLPTIFVKSGLKHVEVSAFAVARATCDIRPMRSMNELIENYRNTLLEFDQSLEESKHFWLEGGISKEELDKSIKLIKEQLEEFVKQPDKILRSGHTATFGWILVTGRKINSNK